MDLNAALDACRHGATIRDDANMTAGWFIYFLPDATEANKKLPPGQRKGAFFYINPRTGPAYQVLFKDAMKASIQWRVKMENE